MTLVQDADLIPPPSSASDAGPALIEVAIRAGTATLFGALALLIPGVAIAGLLLLGDIYLVAAALLAVTAVFKARRAAASWARLVRDDVADLARGNAAVWPIVAIIACVVVLGA